jgi:DNA-binding NarL/FixJ family response regulator
VPNILLVVEEPLVAEGFRSVFARLPGFEATVESRPEQLFQTLAAGSYQALVLRRISGITVDLLARLEREAPGCSVVLCTDEISGELALEAMRLGVRGFLPRTAPLETVAQCVEAVVAGARWFDDFFRSRLFAAKGTKLSPRQSDLVRLVSQGLRNREIARELALTEGTVKVYLSRLFAKLGVKGRFDLALHGLRNAADVAAAAPGGIAERLTARERQIADLLPGGLNNREIAERLSISEGTVKVYLSRMFRKVGVSGRYELAVRSMNLRTPQSGPPLANLPEQAGPEPARLPWAPDADAA